MGRTKERLEELYDRGFGETPDKFVCSSCFNDKGIKDFISSNASEYFCSYCGLKVPRNANPISVPIEDVTGLIVRSIERLYEDPQQRLPWDNEDECYFGEVKDLEDILMDMEFDITLVDSKKFDNLYYDLTSSIDCRSWTPKEPGCLRKSETYRSGWERFVKQVKHNSRYVFFLIKYKPVDDDIDVPFPSEMMEHIHKFIIKNEIIKKVEKGTIFYRARVCFKRKIRDTAKDLGIPGIKDAKFSNRMSPAGIPMFYGSLEKETALKEVLIIKNGRESQNIYVKMAKFKLLKDIFIVDLTKPLNISLFDENIDEIRLNSSIFINHLIRDISQPIKKDGREHVDYVPTQIITEYLKYKCIGPNKKRIRGIFYPSSQGKGNSCALFFRNRHCVDKGKIEKNSYLQLIDAETIKIKR